MGDMPTIAALEAEAETLTLPAFDETTALRLGAALVSLSQDRKLPVVINIRTPTRTLFHAALPGATPMNDLWALRKGNTALAFQASSMLVTLRLREKGRTIEGEGLNPATHVLSGGAVPIVVRGTGMVAVCTVSGLPEQDDHALVVEAVSRLQTAP